MLLDQPGFECDPVSRVDGDTPLHSAVRWINSEPPEQREFGNALVEMMLEAGSNPRIKNKGGLTPLQLVDPRNEGLKEVIRKHEYAALNAGDFVSADEVQGGKGLLDAAARRQEEEEDDDGEFSGSDEEERAEWERRRKAKRG
jgi:negative regulator of genetic competence, sporulation and motility